MYQIGVSDKAVFWNFFKGQTRYEAFTKKNPPNILQGFMNFSMLQLYCYIEVRACTTL